MSHATVPGKAEGGVMRVMLRHQDVRYLGQFPLINWVRTNRRGQMRRSGFRVVLPGRRLLIVTVLRPKPPFR